MRSKSYEMDMCSGALFPKMVLFTLPLIASGVLQLLFNAADIIVVGNYAGSTALAAVGSTSPLINLLINLFIGLSVGANVVVARFYGAGKEKDVSETVHTAILTSVISGIFLTFVGLILAPELLKWMGTPEDVIDQSVLYIRIYFCGMPAMLLYNFGSSILRAIGDTKRPLYFLFAAGVINVGMNLLFVIVFHMGVAGVALATDISQCVSAGLIIFSMMKTPGACQLHMKQIRICWDKLGMIVRTGLPAGIQGSVFSLSNVLIQSSINTFGSVAMAGNTAAGNIEGFVYISINALQQTTLSFTAQNLGGGQYQRIKKGLVYCLLMVTGLGLVLGNLAYFFGTPLLGLYSSDPMVIQYGLLRLSIIVTMYFLAGIMEVLVGALRGLGYSVMPMIVSLIGACGFRIVWIYTIFQWNHTLGNLYMSYPVTWTLTSVAHLICFIVVWKRVYSRGKDGEIEK